MEHVNISDLYPGEILVAIERVAKYRFTLENGGELTPVHVCHSGNRIVARDGHNRIRALIEHRHARGEDAGSVSVVVDGGKPPQLHTHTRWQQVAAKYGCGVEAFLALPVVKESEYYQRHDEIEREINSNARSHGVSLHL